MHGLRRVISNIVISLLGQAITWISTILLTVAYGRFLGDAGFGELYFAITFVSLIGFPIEFGFNQLLTRDVAQKPERAVRYLANTLALKFLLWLPFYGLLVGLSRVLGYAPGELQLVAICGVTLLSTSITNTFAGLHSAFGRTYFSTVGSIFERVIDACAGILLLKLGAGVEVMALVLMVGSLIDTIWQGVWCFAKIGFDLRIDRTLMIALFKSSIPFLLYGILGVIYYRIDTVMLSLMTNNTVVGWYGAAYRLFDTLLFLPSLVISAIMYPIFSKLSVSSERQLRLAIEKTMNFVLFCAIPIATFIIIAAPQIIGFLYHNPDFTHSISTLQALAPGLVFLYANSVLGAILLSTHREKKVTILALIALIFNLTANFILIPRYAQFGAALTTSATELVLLLASLLLVPNTLLPGKSLLSALRILFAAAVMGACVWWLQSYSVLILFPLGLVVYVLMALLSQALPLSDVRTIYQSLRNRKKIAPSIVSNLDQNQLVALAKLDTMPLPGINIFADRDTMPLETVHALTHLKTVPLERVHALAHLDGEASSTHNGNGHASARHNSVDPSDMHAQEQPALERISTLPLPTTPVNLDEALAEGIADEPTIPNLPRVSFSLPETPIHSDEAAAEELEDDEATIPRLRAVSTLPSERSKHV